MSIIGSINPINPLAALSQAQEPGALQNGAGGIPGGLGQLQSLVGGLQSGAGGIPGGLGQVQNLAGSFQTLLNSASGATGKMQGLTGLLQPGVLEGLPSGSSTGGANLIPGGSGATEFTNLLDHAVKEVNAKMNAADAQEAKMLTGESTNLHQTMISVQEAQVALSLMVEVRNKLVESYQQLMQMQV